MGINNNNNNNNNDDDNYKDSLNKGCYEIRRKDRMLQTTIIIITITTTITPLSLPVCVTFR